MMSNFDSSHYGFGCHSNSNSTQNCKFSDQTHIDQGILPVRYDKATARSDNIELCQILTPLIQVSDVDQTQTQLKIANFSDQTHIRDINRGILPVPYDKATAGSEKKSNDVKFLLISYRFRMLIKLKLNSKLQMFPIKLILGILTEGYYQFDMTKPQLDLRTSIDVKR